MNNQYLPDDLIKEIMDINTKAIKEEKEEKAIKDKYNEVNGQMIIWKIMDGHMILATMENGNMLIMSI